ncbi:terminase large subunit domain-containing protein [Larsenimonas rhizosphaerae]|uniref:terminase large subunit domain-containing protein n=1 Tax=Larsenimonas rhizosphaerae TaxID=2944682 RepID=UPI002033351B|nr:terminase family protein [Larsenimonas rhizosphaerae]MCM2131478.1 terminase family protein [Larsenimonas rhizosphaerae]
MTANPLNPAEIDATLDSPDAAKLSARHLYWMGWRVGRIAELLNLSPNTISSWKARDKWDEATSTQRVEGALEARLVMLISKEQKEGRDFKEIDLLGRQIERLARVHKFEGSGKESDLNPNIERRNAGEKKKPARNDVGDEGVIQIVEAFEASLFEYQRHWYRAGQHERIRNLLKSRQIGATWFFAREAIADAIETGKNKIFMSASKAQAHIFRNYIVQFVKETTGVELKGDPIVLANGAELHFLGTNAKTAQGYHGDTYLDEYFWIGGFEQFRKVTSGMAMHKKWKQTYFSTPSSVAHEAYPFWTGERFNKRQKKSDRVEIDVSHAALASGARCADGQWRQIVTIKDAMAGGCDLFDIDQLRLEYSDDEFANLLMCEFVDDSQSAFPMMSMQRCMVDSWDIWRDWKPFAQRPFGDQPVWIGYDPAGEGEGSDGAGLVVLAPAKNRNDRHRILEQHRLKGHDYEAQAEYIREVSRRYNVQYIGIDINGMGDAVAQLVAKWFPRVDRIRYTPDSKSALVRQAQHIIDRGRLEFDARDTIIAQSFTSIRRELTASGRQFTYAAGRNGQTGHADLAWATMHALSNEPIDVLAEGERGGSIMEIYG